MLKTSRLALALAVLLLVAVQARSDEGEYVLNKDNWQKAEGLLPDPVLKRVKAGDYSFKVVPLDAQKFHENYSTSYWAASEANEGKYELDAETCGLKDKATGKMPDWVFGKPFPKIDPKDPQAACKVAWNFYLANQMGEGAGATFTLNGIDRNGEFRRIKLWLHSNAYLGRHKKDDNNPENLRGDVAQPRDGAVGRGGRQHPRPAAQRLDVAGQHLGVHSPDPSLAARERSLALGSNRRPRHLLRRPELLRGQGRVLQVEDDR